MPTPLLAQFSGLTAAALDGSFFTTLLQDPALTAMIAAGISLVLSKLLKVDLSKWIVPLVTALLNGLLKPPGTPTTTPGPVVLPTIPSVPATPATPATPAPATPTIAPLIQLLLDQLLKAKADGDAEAEKEVNALLNRLLAKK